MKFKETVLKKTTPRARQRASAGRVWPAGRILPLPGINGQDYFGFQKLLFICFLIL